ncbi:MAG: GTP pyrophosphokinase family protein [Lachnospiraceae bacterium]|nr:GTP pyrophosphokinase family protein [Lachnospiraceae bacterium]
MITPIAAPIAPITPVTPQMTAEKMEAVKKEPGEYKVIQEAAVLLQEEPEFLLLMMRYKCAIKEVQTKLEVLNEDFSVRNKRNPIERIASRMKTPLSVVEKLHRNKFPVTVESIRENLYDVAGVRVICSFVNDIYTIADLLLKQDDIRLIRKKDYIKNPKDNGYRSMHLIIEVPIFLADAKEYMNVEVQIRTIAMDFWASLEHKIRYKKNIPNINYVENRLKACAEESARLDLEMQSIGREIEAAIHPEVNTDETL